MDIQFHEVADIFPMMAREEFSALKADIAEHGQREAIWLHLDGRIIDGRNRYLACVELGIAPMFRTWDGKGSLVQFVVSLNLHRRHLTSSQKAVIALDILPMLEAEARERQGARTDLRPDGEDLFGATSVKKLPEVQRATAQAAQMVGTNRTYVSQAKNIAQQSPELLEQVRTGKITLSQAKREGKAIQKLQALAEKAAASATAPPTPKLALHVGRAEALNFLGDASVDVIITSPPYNLGAEKWPMGGDGRATRDGIDYSLHDDDLPQNEYERWQVDVLRELFRVAKPGASLFYNHKVRTLGGVMVHPMRWLLDPRNPWLLRQELIWDRKSTHNHSATLFWPEDERIYWMTKGQPTVRSSSIGRGTIWREFGPTPSTWHPAPFTDRLPAWLLDAVGTDAETVVLDPFAGSCTTVSVALSLGCEAIGVDISREYLEQALAENGWGHGSLH